MLTYSRSIRTASSILALAALAAGCAVENGDEEEVSASPEALGNSYLTVMHGANFKGATSGTKPGLLELTAPAGTYSVTLAPNGDSSTACPPFVGGNTPQSVPVTITPSGGGATLFYAPNLFATGTSGTCTLKTSIVPYGQPPSFFGQPQISVPYTK